MKYKGIWFYGLSGSGKSLLSKTIKMKFKNIILIDGDQVRKYISKDLGYNLNDREIQINRIFGICKIIINENFIPVASTVWFNKKLLRLCKKEKIIPIRIDRLKMKSIIKSHTTYKNKKNVVGIDIKYDNFKTKIISNQNNKLFCQNLNFFKKFLEIKDI